MFLFVNVLTSASFKVATGLSFLALLAFWIIWRGYFKNRNELTLSIPTLLEVISIVMTSVSILIPSTGAISIYYLSRINADQLPSAYPLGTVLIWLGLSLTVGIWNALSLGTQYPGGQDLTWKRDHIGHAVFFAAQGIFFFVGIVILTVFFVSTPVDVTDLLRK